MFANGFAIGAIVMALVAIIAYEYFLRQERARATRAEVEAQKWYDIYIGLEARVADSIQRAYVRGAETERHLAEVAAGERRYQDARDA